MITGGFYPAPYIFPARSFCYKLDMGSNSWIISSRLIQTEDQSNSEYAHMAPGTKQDIFTLLGNSQGINSALYMGSRNHQEWIIACPLPLLSPFSHHCSFPSFLAKGERNNMELLQGQGHSKTNPGKELCMWHYWRGQAISRAINVPNGAPHWGSSLLSS